MHCAVLHAAGDVRVDRMDDPVPEAGESLVRITSVGLCGSDLHWFTDGAIGDAALSRPLVLGHEMAGVVVSGPSAGRSVGIDPALPCGHCRECRSGLEHLCTRMHFAGHSDTDGGLRELMAWPDRRLHLLPDGYDPACGSLLEPLGVAVHSADLAHLRFGSTVAVVGCGPIGLMLIELAVLPDARSRRSSRSPTVATRRGAPAPRPSWNRTRSPAALSTAPATWPSRSAGPTTASRAPPCSSGPARGSCWSASPATTPPPSPRRPCAAKASPWPASGG